MKKLFPAMIALSMIALAAAACSSGKGPKTDYSVKPVEFTTVKLDDVFWAPRLDANRNVTVPHIFKMVEESKRVKNFELAAQAMAGAKDLKFCTNYPFDDSDLYKIIEAASYTLAAHPNAELEKYIDGLVAKIAAAQEPDGYLYTVRTIGGPPPVDWLGKERWSNLYMSHELYDLGHLYEAAAAYYEATGRKNLLNIALKSAALVLKEFGPGRRMNPPGHEEIEIGLVKLYRVTGDKRYLDLAKFFVDVRGKAGTHKLYGEYSQDHKPLVEQTEAVGHAVRAGYFYAGAADVAALTGDKADLAALDKIWDDVTAYKIYLTGGIGATGAWEGYGPRYVLPNPSAYAETCANIATFLWNSRMFRLEEDAKFVDVMERILYNSVLSGVSLSGDRFFYPNPLASFGQHERTPWFSCACCPPNVARLLASVPGYVYAVGEDRVYLNLYAQGTADFQVGKTALSVRETTEYPWDGKVVIELKPAKAAVFTLMVRIPGWALNRPLPTDLYKYEGQPSAQPTLKVNGEDVALTLDKGYVPVKREWKVGDKVELVLPMEPRRVLANEAVVADHGRVAIERGPLVYCAEGIDNGGKAANLVLDAAAPLTTERRADLLGGVVVVGAEVQAVSEKAGRRIIEKKPGLLIPYYAWANRGRGEMAVWLAATPDKATPAREPGLAAKAKVSASEGARNLLRLNDGYEPENSADDVSYMYWWPKKGTLEWAQYGFEKPVQVSEASVYWFDDGGETVIPISWRLLYKKGAEWAPVAASGPYGVAKDRYNTVKFKPVRTTALRLEVQFAKDKSGAVQEWKIK